jgi:hypothetical protein
MVVPRDVDARKFARVAKRRLEEAKVIHSKVQLWAAAQYLGGYAVECMLKALVLVTTPAGERPLSGEVTIEWLKKEFGHDLIGLRAGLARRGIRMSREIAGEFVFVSTWDPQLRYEPGPGDPDKTERFLLAAEAILRWADERM